MICPRCHILMRLIYNTNAYKYPVTRIWECDKCGYQEVKQESE
ncbi:hypothetical protein ES703_08493 [subsurface metagenome]